MPAEKLVTEVQGAEGACKGNPRLHCQEEIGECCWLHLHFAASGEMQRRQRVIWACSTRVDVLARLSLPRSDSATVHSLFLS